MGIEKVGGASMNILEELYHGNIRPNEKCFKSTSEYARYVEILSESERQLTAFLAEIPNAEKEQHMLSQMINAQSEISNFAEIEKFIEGFRLGARFVLDVFVVERESKITNIV